MFDPLQSAYRDKHSTETVLIKVQNDILSALDVGLSPILLMLDFSAAFHTIDNDILLSQFCHVYDITADAIDWLRCVSVDRELGFGVPQGSVLGPTMYCLYNQTC